MAEWAQMRGRWILPDVGYYDTGYGRNQLWFVGGGADLLHNSHYDWSQEIYLAQAAGQGSHNERSMWLWTVVDFKLRKHLTAELVCYPTLPLDRTQSYGFDIDRGKMEWAVKPHWLIGPGYNSTVSSDGTSWQSRPFVTMTRKSRSGDYEFWLERIPAGAQMQFRYQLVRDEKR
jgi:hypothetical protein